MMRKGYGIGNSNQQWQLHMMIAAFLFIMRGQLQMSHDATTPTENLAGFIISCLLQVTSLNIFTYMVLIYGISKLSRGVSDRKAEVL